MVTFPFYIILFVYGFFLLAFAAFGLINIGHLVKTGTLTLTSFIATFLFLCFSTFILWATWNVLVSVDWQQPIVIWDSNWLNNFFSTTIFNI